MEERALHTKKGVKSKLGDCFSSLSVAVTK